MQRLQISAGHSVAQAAAEICKRRNVCRRALTDFLKKISLDFFFVIAQQLNQSEEPFINDVVQFFDFLTPFTSPFVTIFKVFDPHSLIM